MRKLIPLIFMILSFACAHRQAAERTPSSTSGSDPIATDTRVGLFKGTVPVVAFVLTPEGNKPICAIDVARQKDLIPAFLETPESTLQLSFKIPVCSQSQLDQIKVVAQSTTPLAVAGPMTAAAKGIGTCVVSFGLMAALRRSLNSVKKADASDKTIITLSAISSGSLPGMMNSRLMGYSNVAMICGFAGAVVGPKIGYLLAPAKASAHEPNLEFQGP